MFLTEKKPDQQMVGKNPSKLDVLWLAVTQRLLASEEFCWNGRQLRYFRNRHNITFANERTIEIPLIRIFLENARDVLEIGNVLNQYGAFPHDVIDKYEVASGVMNEDVCSFDTPKRYDLIVSISTLEHVGWDEIPKNDAGLMSALNNLKRLLTPDGKLVCTLPIGWNPNVDRLLSEHPPFRELYAFKRVNRLNEWLQVSLAEILNLEFYDPFPFANGVVLGIIY